MKIAEKKVVVYGATGYTARFIIEYLREYNVPFTAAGRDAGGVRESLATIPGIETADYEVAEVAHTLEALTTLFQGAHVVCNTVGPFSKLGPVVVEAALAAGAQYTDTTGEQDWLITCEEKYGTDFAKAGLPLSPGIAQMYTTGEIAAQLCLQQPGLDTLDIAVFWVAAPLAPLTHAAGALCMPVLTMGGVIDILATPDLGDFLATIETRRVTHTFCRRP